MTSHSWWQVGRGKAGPGKGCFRRNLCVCLKSTQGEKGQAATGCALFCKLMQSMGKVCRFGGRGDGSDASD